ncbi:MAG: hypothetical protein IJQ82_06380 [Selenomonadaceae bacterium]|nr:hypothetical protein [Selenomonadaceae bacterium]
MGKLKERIKALLVGDSKPRQPLPIKSTTADNSPKKISKLKAHILALLTTDSADHGGKTPAPETRPPDHMSAKADSSADKEISRPNSSTDLPVDGEHSPDESLTIYTASARRLHYWHACSNWAAWNLLREYNLDDSSHNLFWHNKFRIGYDRQAHAITLAIDDTHYYRIPFDESDSRPVSYNQAKSVFYKIYQLMDNYADEYQAHLERIERLCRGEWKV